MRRAKMELSIQTTLTLFKGNTYFNNLFINF